MECRALAWSWCQSASAQLSVSPVALQAVEAAAAELALESPLGHLDHVIQPHGQCLLIAGARASPVHAEEVQGGGADLEVIKCLEKLLLSLLAKIKYSSAAPSLGAPRFRPLVRKLADEGVTVCCLGGLKRSGFQWAPEDSVHCKPVRPLGESGQTKTDFPSLASPNKIGDPTEGNLIVLLRDFYYGEHGGVGQPEPKTHTAFKCLSCLKVLNNVKLMNHMKHHLELERQRGDSWKTHTTCQHCLRQFPTPFQLQCHVESVHTAQEPSAVCHICELSFETDQVLLEHMKDNQRPGEMPYVCQDVTVCCLGGLKRSGLQWAPEDSVHCKPVRPLGESGQTKTDFPSLASPNKIGDPTEGNLIVLLRDFYYGEHRGVGQPELKTHTAFKCLSCLKVLKNVKFMNHMKHHLELEWQRGDSWKTHTTCQHCLRQFPTPFQLQCHIESVHTAQEPSAVCHISSGQQQPVLVMLCMAGTLQPPVATPGEDATLFRVEAGEDSEAQVDGVVAGIRRGFQLLAEDITEDVEVVPDE
ncbi:hypothetical protein MJG53_000058 [Ovis ammon polii x Ovis aries]|nr:hypothetical protein MJG53_000058 [Ovis ammon polii x Ovis aries]